MKWIEYQQGDLINADHIAKLNVYREWHYNGNNYDAWELIATLDADDIHGCLLGVIEEDDETLEEEAHDAIIIFEQLIVEALNMLNDGGTIKYYMMHQLVQMAIKEAVDKQEGRG